MSRAKRTADGMSALAFPDRSSASSRAERRALKRAFGLPVSILDYADPGTTVWSDAFDAAMADIPGSGDPTLDIPAGNYNTVRPIWVDGRVHIRGRGRSLSVINPSHLQNGMVIDGLNGVGQRITGISIAYTSNAHAAGAGIVILNYQNPANPQDFHSPDFLVMDDLNITGAGTSTMDYCIVVDGNSRKNSDGGTVPLGVRDIKITNVVAFNATVACFDFRHVRVGYYEGMNGYGGLGIGGTILSSIPPTIAYNQSFVGCTLNGAMVIDRVDAVDFIASVYGGPLTKGGTVTNLRNTTSLPTL